MTTSNEPWKELMNEVDKIYNLKKYIPLIYLVMQVLGSYLVPVN